MLRVDERGFQTSRAKVVCQRILLHGCLLNFIKSFAAKHILRTGA